MVGRRNSRQRPYRCRSSGFRVAVSVGIFTLAVPGFWSSRLRTRTLRAGKDRDGARIDDQRDSRLGRCLQNLVRQVEPANVNTNLTLALQILPNFLRPPKVATARGGRPQKPRPFSAVHCTIAHQCALARMCVVCHGSELRQMTTLTVVACVQCNVIHFDALAERILNGRLGS